MIGKLIELKGDLYFKIEDENLLIKSVTILYVKNVNRQDDGFHQISGWYIDPKPLLLNESYEIVIEDDGISCRVIKPIKNE